jgi:hypothetical protein
MHVRDGFATLTGVLYARSVATYHKQDEEQFVVVQPHPCIGPLASRTTQESAGCQDRIRCRAGSNRPTHTLW